MAQPPGKPGGLFLKKLNLELPMIPSFHSWVFTPNKDSICPHKVLFLNVQSRFVIAVNWKQRCVNKLYSVPMEENTTQQWKGVNYWYLQPLGWISRELCWTKRANPKGLHTMGFHLYYILEMTKLQEWRISWWMPGAKRECLWEENGCIYKRATQGIILVTERFCSWPMLMSV